MPLPLLAIATGAINIGKKLFGGIKARQQKKKAKRAAKQAKKDAAIAGFESTLAGAAGATTITESGNLLAGFKSFLDGGQSASENATKIPGGDRNIPDDDDDDSGSGGGGFMAFFKTPVGIAIGIFVAIVIGKKMKLF